MADRSECLQETVGLVGRLVEDGSTEDEIQGMLAAAVVNELVEASGTRR